MRDARRGALGRLSQAATGQRQRLEARRRIDALFTARPFFGARRIARTLSEEGFDRPQARAQADAVDGDRGARAEAENDQARSGHKIYPDLLRDLAIERPNQVWAADITYIPIGRGFTWSPSSTGRAGGFSWRLSNTMDASFCVAALEEALAGYGEPDISTPTKAAVHQRGFTAC